MNAMAVTWFAWLAVPTAASAAVAGGTIEADTPETARIERLHEVCRSEFAARFPDGLPERLETADEMLAALIHRRLIPELAASDSAEDRFAALLWSWSASPEERRERQRIEAHRQRQLDRLEDVLRVDPRHVPALTVAYLTCRQWDDHSLCHADLADQIAAADPGNAWSWLLVADDRWNRGDPAGAVKALDQVADKPVSRYETKIGWWAWRAAERRLAPLEAAQRAALATSAAFLMMMSPMGPHQSLMQVCGPEELVARGAKHLQRCLGAADTLIESSPIILDRVVGYALREFAYEAREPRRPALIEQAVADREALKEWQWDHAGTSCDMLSLDDADYWVTYLRELADHGEETATLNRLDRDLDRWLPRREE